VAGKKVLKQDEDSLVLGDFVGQDVKSLLGCHEFLANLEISPK
jgi:hypothetical protein